MSERELSKVTAPTPRTEEELLDYIRQLLNRKHDYATCVYAVSLATTATFNYMKDQLGITRSQSGCAGLDVLGRVCNLEFGFRILDYRELLYPQYLNKEDFPTVEDLLSEHKEWLQMEARRLLKENHPSQVSSTVWKHWQKLAG